MVKSGLRNDTPSVISCIGKSISCAHFFTSPVIFVITIVLLADFHWIAYRRETNLTDINAWCGIFYCVGPDNTDWDRQWVVVNCNDCEMTNLCYAAKFTSVFVVVSFVISLGILQWNILVCARGIFGKPTLIPAFWWQCLRFLLDLGLVLNLFLSWLLFVALDPEHTPAGQWGLGPDYAFCLVAFFLAIGNSVLSCANLIWQPMDDDYPLIKLWNY